ncbi:TPA: 4Fe-4S binding protein [Candidatus Woesearchaeota archaeon]|nr:4Fe-4S binding protein [Candidatus Woesearchaeota archaeon]
MKTRQKIRKALIIISFLLFPITIFYFSPYLIVVGSFEGVIVGSFITFAAMFIASLFIGRLFCGWVCPGAGLQECLFTVKDKKVSQRYNFVKFLIWSPWMLLIAFAAYRAGGYRSFDPLFHTTYGISVANPWMYIIYYSIILLVLVPALAVGSRSFCHHICWMSPFMIIGRKAGNLLKTTSLRLRSDKKRCIDCLICNKNCPMSLDVHKMVKDGNMENPECILCFNCIDNCPKKVIQ